MSNNNRRNNIWSKKPQGKNNGRYNVRYSNEHDNREHVPRDIAIRKSVNGKQGRKVSFKPGSVGNAKMNLKRENFARGIASMEDDERMESGRSSTFRRRNSPIPGRNKNRGLIEAAGGWFQVTIPHGNKYDKDFVLKSLLNAAAPEVFIPNYWSVENMAVQFYVDDFKMATTLANLDRTIEMPNGFKLIVKVRNAMPPVKIDAAVRERMKLVMAKRYNAATKALDLTQFHRDVDLQDIYCGLSRAPYFSAACDIISENIPELEAMNLDGNKFHTVELFRKHLDKLPNLKILYMANNKIETANTLDALKSSNIIDLVLKGNPICNNLRDEATYVREVRKRMPKLQKLDGVELPAQIGFDIEPEQSSKQPLAKASFLIDQAGGDIVRQFLQQYFLVYDSDNRQPLLEAYHENAMFSLTCSYNPNPEYKLTNYLPHSRNLKRIQMDNRQVALLKCGRLPVVSFLSELPSTEHDPLSFAVDLSHFSPSLILLTVTGIFREKASGTTSQRNALRSFHRSLVIVPVGGGFCIKNDILHVAQTTIHQAKTAFKPISPEPVTTGPVQPPIVPTPTSALNTSLPPDDSTKLQMIEAMSQASQMNLEWSRKCLEDTNWDFQRAGQVFTEVHKQGKIPPEAFIK